MFPVKPNLLGRLLPILMAFVLFGCGGAETEPTSGNEWAVQEGTLQLQRNLLVSEGESFYFGDIRDVAVDDSGRIHVADGQAHHVKILSPDGSFIDSLGTQGQGPGEFERPSQLFFARGDSLYVLDGYYGRLSVFASDRDFAYRFSLRSGPSHPQDVLASHGKAGYLVYYSTPIMPSREEERGGATRVVGPRGTAGDTLFTVPPPQMYIERGNGYVRGRTIPFARGPRIAAGPEDHVHYAWSGSLTVLTYDRSGAPRDTVDIPFEPVPVTEADREQALSGRSAESKKAVQNEIPATKPAFDQFLVDDEGRYWFGRPTADPDSIAWWVAEPEEKRVMTDSCPPQCGSRRSKMGMPMGTRSRGRALRRWSAIGSSYRIKRPRAMR